ncbi:MAG: hypothetical protein NC416_00170 [Eubacterium sp.]|nr:hypothetical protein [Eubacterium sp.]
MKKGFGGVLSTLAGMAAGAVAGGVSAGSISSKKIKKMSDGAAKVHVLYMAFDQWLHVRQEGKTLVEYFEKQGYKTVAIYGMKELGERLYDELQGSDITVKYIIDKNADSIYADVDVITPDEELEPVDVIVVTAIYFFDEIEEMLSEKVDYPIVSLEDILYEV